MTREEAIAIFRGFKLLPREMEAVNMAIKALKKEPCEDCISRQEAVEKINALCNDDVNNPYRDNPHIDAIVDQLMDFPSVTPQQKVGQWIEGKYRDDDIRYNDSSYKCNKCGRIVDFKENYCPDCGAKMRESEEEE